eukprot:COSAG01_NODE_69_length_28801_cov_10.460038_21_plen_334_part_00
MISLAIQLEAYDVSLSNLSQSLSLSALPINTLKKDDVLLGFLAAAVNPADYNMIQGKYLQQPTLPFTLGNEGVFEVLECGEGVVDLQKGDRVILPFKDELSWQGGWCSHCVVSADYVVKIPDTLPLDLAAMATVNPLTAFLLLTKFETLSDSDWLIQNAANSNLGRWIACFASQLNLNCVNVIRSEEAKSTLPSFMQKTALLYHERLHKTIKNDFVEMRLALNGVGGDQAKSLAKTLAPYGTMVTYGAMAKQPVTLGNALLIYQNIKLTGFNRSRYVAESYFQDVKRVYEQVFAMMMNVDLADFPVAASFPLRDFQKALAGLDGVGKVMFLAD